MIKRNIVIGNWKMNPASEKEALKLSADIAKSLPPSKKTDVVICPPFLYLSALKKLSKKIHLGAQNVFPGDTGAFTGEISIKMLQHAGVGYVVLGHSERRAFGESNTEINKKIKGSLSAKLTPILCIGEGERDANHEYLNFIKVQIEECLVGISANLISNIIIAYEPIWAIGKDASREATPDEFLEISIFIKKVLSDKFGSKSISNIRILYGGSVDPKNTLSFMKDGKADGFLVGRSSLNAKKFLEIIAIAAHN